MLHKERLIVPATLLAGSVPDARHFDAVGHYSRVLNSKDARCCAIDCNQMANYAVFERGTDREQTYDDYSYACEKHLGELNSHSGAETKEGSAHYVVVPVATNQQRSRADELAATQQTTWKPAGGEQCAKCAAHPSGVCDGHARYPQCITALGRRGIGEAIGR